MTLLGIPGPAGIIFLALILVVFIIPLLIGYIMILRSNHRIPVKLLWIFCVIFTHPLGLILYFIFGRNKQNNDNLEL